jgi:hypothetical protein
VLQDNEAHLDRLALMAHASERRAPSARERSRRSLPARSHSTSAPAAHAAPHDTATEFLGTYS